MTDRRYVVITVLTLYYTLILTQRVELNGRKAHTLHVFLLAHPSAVHTYLLLILLAECIVLAHLSFFAERTQPLVGIVCHPEPVYTSSRTVKLPMLIQHTVCYLFYHLAIRLLNYTLRKNTQIHYFFLS